MMQEKNIPFTYQILISLALIFGLTSLATATSILPVNLKTLTDKSELIVQGKITKSRAYRDPASNMIYTEVTIKPIDAIKGKSAAPIILRFMGGIADGEALVVEGMTYPKLNEEGIYFIESTSRSQVNPITGWSQGHYLIQPDTSGQSRVMSNKRHAITRFDTAQTNELHSHEAARGLTVNETAPPSHAITVSEFKQQIRNLQQ